MFTSLNAQQHISSLILSSAAAPSCLFKAWAGTANNNRAAALNQFLHAELAAA